jgi:hypothetical protein
VRWVLAVGEVICLLFALDEGSFWKAKVIFRSGEVRPFETCLEGNFVFFFLIFIYGLSSGLSKQYMGHSHSLTEPSHNPRTHMAHLGPSSTPEPLHSRVFFESSKE